jgi:hypothetical protein
MTPGPGQRHDFEMGKLNNGAKLGHNGTPIHRPKRRLRVGFQHCTIECVEFQLCKVESAKLQRCKIERVVFQLCMSECVGLQNHFSAS